MTNHPNRGRAARAAKAYAAALPGALRVRVTPDSTGTGAGVVYVYGARPGADGVGWYAAGTVAELADKAAADQPTNGR